MSRKSTLLLALLCSFASAQTERQSLMQYASFPRLGAGELAVTPPAQRVTGEPGSMRIIERGCGTGTNTAVLRQRIVDIAVQEWAWFGFNVDDQRGTTPPPRGSNQSNNNAPRLFMPLDAEMVARVAPSVGGYWSAAPDSDWILARQNEAWNGDNGLESRWRDPWSAAFISWVMCESGLGDPTQFKRAIAHHSYIDQAILASDGRSSGLFHAFEPGDAAVNPGDLLCSGLRPLYRSLAERKAQIGVGARTHCDIVVEVNEAAGQILTIGGNVRSSVRMKIFPASAAAGKQFAPEPTARPIFAHLQLQAPAINATAVEQTPTIRAMSCSMPTPPATLTAAALQLPASAC